jgi:hypothetical protein
MRDARAVACNWKNVLGISSPPISRRGKRMMRAYSVPVSPKMEWKKMVLSIAFAAMKRMEPQSVVPKSLSRFLSSLRVIFIWWADRLLDFRMFFVLAAIMAISEPEKNPYSTRKHSKRRR